MLCFISSNCVIDTGLISADITQVGQGLQHAHAQVVVVDVVVDA
jgi:hypothetical protein